MADVTQLDPVLADLADRIRAALRTADLPEADPALERPRQPEHGDWATPVALGLAKEARMAPREIAERLVEHLDAPEQVAAVEIAGPGFVNFRLSHGYFQDRVLHVLEAAERYGRHERADGERVNLEFVSANPTGPLHVGHGRRAAEGDAIAALLEAVGDEVTREYYFNDAGRQMRMLGESVVRTVRGEDLDEDHYRGEYVAELVRAIHEERGAAYFDGDDVVERATHEAGRLMIDEIRGTLHRLGVDFDIWFSEQQLHDGGDVKAALEQLDEAGHTYEADGALWLRTTDFGDDKDRVLVRSDGRPTYQAADCAYLHNKLERGFDRLIYLLGTDHHGWAQTQERIVAAFGIDADLVEIRLGQFVNLTRGGEPVKMSTRAGEFVTLDELIDEVGVDVARYHFLRTSMDQTIDFDLEEVVKRSMDNPIYYVQYAHARIASILRNADEGDFEPGAPGDAALHLLTEPTEEELMRRMAELPEVVAEAAELRAPHRLARYAEDLAGSFHRFYTECRVLGVREDLGRARYWLAIAAKQVLANALGLLRVSAPDRL